MRKVLSGFLILLIRFYQAAISPYLMPSCRFIPSCSVYGIDAIRRHGPFKGFWLTFRRFIRCHPWGGNGYDPVP